MEENKNGKGTKISPVPCILMIIFLPFIIVYFILSLLFVPIDYLIFKFSLYHRDFGGKYTFLSGAHPDNRLYTAIKKNKTPVIYAKCDKAYESHGFFFTQGAIVEVRGLLFFDREKGEWMGALPTVDGARPCSMDELDSALLDAFTKATGGMKRERVYYLVPKRTAKRYGKAAYDLLLADGRAVVFDRKTLVPKLCALA